MYQVHQKYRIDQPDMRSGRNNVHGNEDDELRIKAWTGSVQTLRDQIELGDEGKYYSASQMPVELFLRV